MAYWIAMEAVTASANCPYDLSLVMALALHTMDVTSRYQAK